MKYREERGRANVASARDDFERALRGDDSPRERAFDADTDRKTLQLCRQIQRALMLELQGEVQIDSVEPMGGAAQMLVRMAHFPGADRPGIETLQWLHGRTPMLRAAVARSICRKRVPGLSFILVAREGSGAQGGMP